MCFRSTDFYFLPPRATYYSAYLVFAFGNSNLFGQSIQQQQPTQQTLPDADFGDFGQHSFDQQQAHIDSVQNEVSQSNPQQAFTRMQTQPQNSTNGFTQQQQAFNSGHQSQPQSQQQQPQQQQQFSCSFRRSMFPHDTGMSNASFPSKSSVNSPVTLQSTNPFCKSSFPVVPESLPPQSTSSTMFEMKHTHNAAGAENEGSSRDVLTQRDYDDHNQLCATINKPTDEITTMQPDKSKSKTTRNQRRREAKRRPIAERQEHGLLQRDNERSRAERRLLQDTKALPHQCRLEPFKLRVFENLFKSKQSLPSSKTDRVKDDCVRRMAVKDIMVAREEAGFEVAGEASRWRLGVGQLVDIAKELRAKFDPIRCMKMKQRLECRNSQLRFLEWNLAHPDRAGIPESQVDWLRKKCNETVRTLDDEDAWGKIRLQGMQVCYYIMACRKAAGVPLDFNKNSFPDTYSEDFHDWLLTLPKEAFEQEDFVSEMLMALEHQKVKLDDICELQLDLEDVPKMVKVDRWHIQENREEIDPCESESEDADDDSDTHEHNTIMAPEPGWDDGPMAPEPMSEREYQELYGDDRLMAPEPMSEKEYQELYGDS